MYYTYKLYEYEWDELIDNNNELIDKCNYLIWVFKQMQEDKHELEKI